MTWELKHDRPVYTQLLEQIQLRIISGEFPPGSKLPSVRDLAANASVNPNTMQKALTELERNGLVYSQRTTGRFITEDEVMIKQVKDNIAVEQIVEFLEKMKKLGFNTEEIMELMKSSIHNQKN